MNFSHILNFFKMIYKLLCYTSKIITFLFNILWLCCTLASAGIPWFSLLFLCICIASKFIKLKSPNNKQLLSFYGDIDNNDDDTILIDSSKNGTTNGIVVNNEFNITTNATTTMKTSSSSDCLHWPIANRGAAYDAPENSVAAIKKCVGLNCRNILLDISITKCGELVILHKSTIEKANINESISQITFDSLQNFNISEHHPLANQFQPEKILSLANLMTLLDNLNINVFLLISSINSKFIEKLKEAMKKDDNILKRIILCCSSPIAIYQLRKTYPELVCGLWIESTLSCKNTMPYILKTSTLFMSVYGAFLRNIIAPVIGISIVFINKEEFNAHLSSLWKNVGVRPIVYSVNSPNEKRYFQKIIKVQYVTDSLRSEPQLIIKTKK